MERKIYKGRFQPYLEDVVIREISQLKRKPLDTVDIVVAANLLRRHLSGRLAEEQGAAAGIKFWGFNDIEQLGHKNFRVVDKKLSQQEMILLVLKAIEEVPQDDLFCEFKEKIGFARAVLETIADLKDAGITPDELKEIINKKKLSSTKKRLAELYKRYEEFKQELRALDSKDLLSQAISALKSNPPKHDHPVFIYGIYDITNQQKELLEAFLGDSDAVAAVPWWDGIDRYVERYLGFLHELGFREACVEKEAINEKGYCLWNDGSDAEVFSSPNKVMEARSIIRKIFDYCVEEKIPLDEVGILIRQPEDYLETFKDEFKSAGIPYRAIVGEPMIKTPPGKAFYLLLEFLDSNYSRRAFLTLLDGAVFKEHKFPLTPYQWIEITNKASIVEGKENWFNNLNAFIEETNREDYSYDDYDEKIKSITVEDLSTCKEFLHEFFEKVEAVLKAEKWREFKDALEKLWSGYFDFEEFVPANNNVRKIINSFADMDKFALRFNFKLAKELIIDALVTEEADDDSSCDCGVVLTGLMSARCVPFKVAAVPGLVEGSFPRKVSQDALLLDEERVLINEIRKASEKPKIDEKLRGLEEEKLLFGLAMQAGAKKVFVSYPRMEEGGKKEKMPSVFFLKAGEKKKGELITAEKLEEFKEFKLSNPFAVDPAKALSEFEFKMAVLNRIAADTELTSTQENSTLGFPQFPHLKRALIAKGERYNRGNFTPYEGVLTPDRGLPLLKEEFDYEKKVYSPSELETYAKCPFSYFLKRVLKLREYEEPEKIWEMEPVDAGKLVHKILARFYRDLKNRKLLPITEEQKEERKNELKKIAEEEFNIAENSGLTGFKLLWEFRKRTILDWLNSAIEEDVKSPTWVPERFEAIFGFGEGEGDVLTPEPVTLRFAEGGIKLRGRIDRIDFCKENDAIRVIDYKTGSSYGYSNSSTNKGVHIQALLYAYCASKILDKSLDLACGGYFFLKKNQRYCQNFYEMRDEVERVIDTVLNGINNGLFFPYKESCKSDKYTFCAFKFLCRGAEEICENKKEDARLEKWKIIKEAKEKGKARKNGGKRGNRQRGKK